MGNIWFTSDLHFGHRKVAELRGFSSVERHDEVIVRNILKVIRPGDVLWVLGDLNVGSGTEWVAPIKLMGEALDPRTSRATSSPATPPGELNLIWGNHDRGWIGNRNAHNHQALYRFMFNSTNMMGKIGYKGVRFMLSHMPYSGDSQHEDRFPQWRLRDEGDVLIHGHTHSTEKFSRSSKGTPQLHCGLDAWDLKPVSIADLKKVLMSEKHK